MEEQKTDNDKEIEGKDRKAFYEYLAALHRHFEPYHGRKEQVIWAATTIYLTGLFAIGVGIVKKEVQLPIWVAFLLIASLLPTLACALIFIGYHDVNQYVAGQIVKAVQILRSQLADPNFPLLESFVKPKTCRCRINEQEYTFPFILWETIWGLLEKKKLPKWKTWIAKCGNKYGKNNTPLYVIVILWTIFVIFLVPFSCDNTSGTTTPTTTPTSISTMTPIPVSTPTFTPPP